MLLGQSPALGRSAGGNHPDARGLEQLDHDQSDAAGAQHDGHVERPQPGTAIGVYGRDYGTTHQAGTIERHSVGNHQQVRGGNGEVLGKRAGPGDAQDAAEVRALLLAAGAAEAAVRTTEKQMRDHPLADRQRADVRPHGRHYARRLMAWYVRQTGHVGQPVLDVQVGAADAAGASLDQDLIRPDHRLRHAFDLKRLSELLEYGCFHGGHPNKSATWGRLPTCQKRGRLAICPTSRVCTFMATGHSQASKPS